MRQDRKSQDGPIRYWHVLVDQYIEFTIRLGDEPNGVLNACFVRHVHLKTERSIS